MTIIKETVILSVYLIFEMIPVVVVRRVFLIRNRVRADHRFTIVI